MNSPKTSKLDRISALKNEHELALKEVEEAPFTQIKVPTSKKSSKIPVKIGSDESIKSKSAEMDEPKRDTETSYGKMMGKLQVSIEINFIFTRKNDNFQISVGE